MNELVAKINLLEKNALWESSVAPDDRDSWKSRLTVSTPRNHFELSCCYSDDTMWVPVQRAVERSRSRTCGGGDPA